MVALCDTTSTFKANLFLDNETDTC